eukprot:6208439-Pleurochrysis_carterae.AAC.7
MMTSPSDSRCAEAGLVQICSKDSCSTRSDDRGERMSAQALGAALWKKARRRWFPVARQPVGSTSRKAV